MDKCRVRITEEEAIALLFDREILLRYKQRYKAMIKLILDGI